MINHSSICVLDEDARISLLDSSTPPIGKYLIYWLLHGLFLTFGSVKFSSIFSCLFPQLCIFCLFVLVQDFPLKEPITNPTAMATCPRRRPAPSASNSCPGTPCPDTSEICTGTSRVVSIASSVAKCSGTRTPWAVTCGDFTRTKPASKIQRAPSQLKILQPMGDLPKRRARLLLSKSVQGSAAKTTIAFNNST